MSRSPNQSPANVVALPTRQQAAFALRRAIRKTSLELQFPVVGISLRCGVPAFGFPGLLPIQYRVPSDRAMCKAAFDSRDVFSVKDLKDDPIFSSNPLVVGDPFFRTFVGCPLADQDGVPIGTLCMFDHAPRTLSDGQCDLVRAHAAAISACLAAHLDLAAPTPASIARGLIESADFASLVGLRGEAENFIHLAYKAFDEAR